MLSNTTDHSVEWQAQSHDPRTATMPVSALESSSHPAFQFHTSCKPCQRSPVDSEGLAGFPVRLVEPCCSFDEFAADSLHVSG